MFVYELSSSGFESCPGHLNLHIVPIYGKEFIDIQANIERGFTLKHLCEMIGTYSQMNRIDKYLQLSSPISSVWSNG